MRSSLAWTGLAIVLASALACAAELREPSRGPQRAEGATLVAVGYPPPPAVPEHVPPDPGEPCVWVDGHWHWALGRWVWKGGGYVIPPRGCYYAESTLIWLPSGQAGELAYLAPNWYAELGVKPPDTKQNHVCAPPVPCGNPAAPKPGAPE